MTLALSRQRVTSASSASQRKSIRVLRRVPGRFMGGIIYRRSTFDIAMKTSIHRQITKPISRPSYHVNNTLPRSQNPQAFSGHQICKRHSSYKPADMSYISDSARLRGMRDRADTVDELQ